MIVDPPKSRGRTILLLRASIPRVGISLTVGLVGWFLPGCAPFVSVKQSPPRIPSSKAFTGDLAVVRKELSDAQKIKDPIVALGDDLAAAEIAARSLPNQPEARDLYNFAVARSVENMGRSGIEPWHRDVKIPGPDGGYVLSGVQPQDEDHDPSNYTLLPTDKLRIGGTSFATRATVTGVGAPVVAIRRNQAPYRGRFGIKRVYAAATAVLKFQDHRVKIEFIERFASERVVLAGRSYRLAGDFSAPLAMTLVMERPDKYRLGSFLRPEKYPNTAHLICLQPFDPQRTPVIFVHGLHETPTVWAPMINSLRDDLEIRRRYQFWVFSYPNGYSYPYAAALFRRELKGMAQAFPDRKRAVLIGYSMGGVVSRLMVMDAGDKIWRAFFGKSPAATPVTGRTRELLEKSLIFYHQPEVKSVIFIGTPHRGTNWASNWIGRVVSSLIKDPFLITNLRESVFPLLTFDPAALHLNQMPNAVNSLAPNNPFILEMNKIPIAPGISYHTIEGDRGRGDAPNSSDGIVGYWSSHLDGAQSETIVPSNHFLAENSEAIAEVKRILRSSP